MRPSPLVTAPSARLILITACSLPGTADGVSCRQIIGPQQNAFVSSSFGNQKGMMRCRLWRNCCPESCFQLRWTRKGFYFISALEEVLLANCQVHPMRPHTSPPTPGVGAGAGRRQHRTARHPSRRQRQHLWRLHPHQRRPLAALRPSTGSASHATAAAGPVGACSHGVDGQPDLLGAKL